MELEREKDVIELCGKVGKILLENGAETARVEGTVEYIGKAAGVDLACHAAMTAIFVDANDNPLTHLVKVRALGISTCARLTPSTPYRANSSPVS